MTNTKAYQLLRNSVQSFVRSFLGCRLVREDRVPTSTIDIVDVFVGYLINKSADFYFIQIGANDGRDRDPLNHVIRKYGLRGLLVEPLPSTFDRPSVQE